MKRVLLIGNHEVVIYNFRKELIERLLQENHEVYISSPYGKKIDLLVEKGCHFIESPLERHGLDPRKEIKLFFYYIRIMTQIKPHTVVTYTVKPNIYGGIAAEICKVPYIATITGLGTGLEESILLKKMMVFLYKIAFLKIETVFFQNEQNLNFFKKERIVKGNYKVVAGSGVNLDEFLYLSYPDDMVIKFTFIGRVSVAKGIREYLRAADIIHKKYKKIEFHICGFIEETGEPLMEGIGDKSYIIYHGMINDIRTILKDIHCVVLPSYHEGMSNALLEAAACGRPLIVTDIPGCKEIVEDEKTGFLIQAKNEFDLAEKMEKFIKLPLNDKTLFGLRGRERMKCSFDRNKIVDSYMQQIRGDS